MTTTFIPKEPAPGRESPSYTRHDQAGPLNRILALRPLRWTITGAAFLILLLIGKTVLNGGAIRYTFATVSETGESVEIGGDGSPLLSLIGAQLAVAEAGRSGWQIHSIVPVVSGASSSYHSPSYGEFSSGGFGSGYGRTGTDFIVLLQK